LTLKAKLPSTCGSSYHAGKTIAPTSLFGDVRIAPV
jgi:hypothetical protein